MLDNQMFELLDKLKKVNYETIDIDDFLDQRECDPFDSEWVRVYQTIEELKKGKEMVDTREIEKKAYITVYEKTECDDLAGYIADDFGLIADSIMLHYSDEWLEKVISCYNDILRGGFGQHSYNEPIHIKWLFYEKSLHDLGSENVNAITEIILDTNNSGHDCTLELL